MNAKLAFKRWLRTRPKCVQLLAAEFPIETTVEIDGEKHWVMGWTEGDQLIITPVDPVEDYDGAFEARTYLCAGHLRATVAVTEQQVKS